MERFCMVRRVWFVWLLLALDLSALTLPATAGTSGDAINTDFSNPEVVTIQGYNGPQEDPNISPDNQYIFFDSHNDAGLPEYLYMAKPSATRTFKFVGRVPGVNFEAVGGVEDSAHNFYFVSPLLLGQGGQTTIGHGTFSNGS